MAPIIFLGIHAKAKLAYTAEMRTHLLSTIQAALSSKNGFLAEKLSYTLSG
ncbi:hypothetical protein ACFLXB_01970 [Chloroflexota bacterium]